MGNNRNKELRPGQVGNFWLDKKPGRKTLHDPWCRTWYDAKARQTRYISLGTADVQEAREILEKWYILNKRPKSERPDEAFIEAILLRYYEEHGQFTVGRDSIRFALSLWQVFWKEKTVADITPLEQRKFRASLDNGVRGSATLDRILSTGRAALKHAVKNGELASSPMIFMTETLEERRARPPMGRPVVVQEIAQLLDHVKSDNLFFYIMLASNTLSRNKALFDLQRKQFDADKGRLNLNPPGRRQNKKFRPIIPVTSYLRPWLNVDCPGDAYYISRHGKRVHSIRTSWTRALKDAGLPTDISPYSFRHGMAREMRARGVPLDQIGLFLGHLPRGSNATTAIYAPMEPEYCTQAIAAIEQVMAEVQSNMRSGVAINDPHSVRQFQLTNRPAGYNLGDAHRAELISEILAGAETPDLVERFGITEAAVRKARKSLEGSF